MSTFQRDLLYFSSYYVQDRKRFVVTNILSIFLVDQIILIMYIIFGHAEVVWEWATWL